jgi:hypothetical protein
MESSRSVVHLSTEQLYRKRAFDRENQRASRYLRFDFTSIH